MTWLSALLRTQVFINTGWERSVLLTRISDLYSGVILVSFCDLENVYACSIYFFYFLDINNLVSGLAIFVFQFGNLRARPGVVIYAFYPFFHQKITSVCKNHTSPVNRKSTDLAL